VDHAPSWEYYDFDNNCIGINAWNVAHVAVQRGAEYTFPVEKFLRLRYAGPLAELGVLVFLSIQFHSVGTVADDGSPPSFHAAINAPIEEIQHDQ
jgi:uncharacterized membrane protein